MKEQMGISLQLPPRPKVELSFTSSPVDFFSPSHSLLPALEFTSYPSFRSKSLKRAGREGFPLE